MAELDGLLRYLKECKGSDLHLAAGVEPRVRARGALEAVPGMPVLTNAQLLHVMKDLAEERHWLLYQKENDVDFAYAIPGVARFRVNYFMQQNGAGVVARVIPDKVLTLEELGTPPAVEGLAHLSQGLVLVTGPTGSGKSTTLAGIIDRINSTYSKHVVTIEDPIEFVHPTKKCAFSQREVGRHSSSFSDALKAAIRQDADVILVGELRDLETISLALTAAEMGVLVFGTLHTNSASKTIDRLVDAFPSEQQAQVRLMLSESLAGIVAQQLLKTSDGKGRCAAQEILLKTPGLANLVREGNVPMLYSSIQAGRSMGMQTMDDALMDLVKAGKVNVEDVYTKALDKGRFEKLMSKDTAAAGGH